MMTVATSCCTAACPTRISSSSSVQLSRREDLLRSDLTDLLHVRLYFRPAVHEAADGTNMDATLPAAAAAHLSRPAMVDLTTADDNDGDDTHGQLKRRLGADSQQATTPSKRKRSRTARATPGRSAAASSLLPLGGPLHTFEGGCAAIRTPIAGAGAFERQLRACATRWLRRTLDASTARLRAELAKTSKAGIRRVPRYPLLAALDLERDAAERAELQRILDQVDLADDRIFATVFNASERKAWCAAQAARAAPNSALTAAHGNDLAALVRWGLDGAANAQGQPHLGWRLSGFGIFTNLHGLDWPLRHGLPAMQRALAGVSDVRGLPTVIFKPPHGGELKAHNDSGSWAQLFALTGKYRTVREWVAGEGVQALMHVRGAGPQQKGRTCLLGPMTVKRFRTLLMLAHPDHPHPGMPLPDVATTTVEPGAVSGAPAAVAASGAQSSKWALKWVESGGPVFYKWDSPKALAVANRLLTYFETATPQQPAVFAALCREDKSWLASVERATGGQRLVDSVCGDAPRERLAMRPICPLPPPAAAAATAACSAGAAAAAMGNGKADDAVETDDVYTAVWPLGFIHCAEKTTDAARLTLCPAICRPVGGHDTALLQRSARRLEALATRDHTWLAQDRQPYAGGAVHRHPECEAGLLEFFGEMYLDAAQIASAQRHVLPADESEPAAAAATATTPGAGLEAAATAACAGQLLLPCPERLTQ